MADIADITDERNERETPHLIAASKKPSGPAPTGVCLWCSERLPDPMRWCDAECRGQWQHYRDRGGQ